MEEKDLRQALQVLESYKGQMETLSRQINILQVSLEESVRARETLKAFADAKEGDEVLVPIGASVFVAAKVTGSREAIVGIGNRVSIDKDLTEATEYLGSGVVEIQEALKKASAAFSEMQSAANNLADAINAEYEARQPA
ncbi:MAG: prefoldin subunit alpha [Candidatus Methanomethylophilaceae archaeon]|nr:prefoldin alpha subunit [Candidatus Methanomethylophilaceae archaeon]